MGQVISEGGKVKQETPFRLWLDSIQILSYISTTKSHQHAQSLNFRQRATLGLLLGLIINTFNKIQSLCIPFNKRLKLYMQKVTEKLLGVLFGAEHVGQLPLYFTQVKT